MADGSPRCNRPDLIFASHPGTKLPRAKFALYLSKASDDLIHCRALRRILLDHVGDEWFDEIKTMKLLFHATQNDYSWMNRVCRPGYSPLELSFRDSIHQLGMDCRASFGLGAQVPTCHRHGGGDQEEVH
jgi:hypothetical protein